MRVVACSAILALAMAGRDYPWRPSPRDVARVVDAARARLLAERIDGAYWNYPAPGARTTSRCITS